MAGYVISFAVCAVMAVFMLKQWNLSQAQRQLKCVSKRSVKRGAYRTANAKLGSLESRVLRPL
jgi:hypothetical protein